MWSKRGYREYFLKVSSKSAQGKGKDTNGLNQPEIYRKLIKEIVYPEHGSVRDRYLEETIKILKNKAKQKVKAAKLNEIFINKDLYFIPVYIKN